MSKATYIDASGSKGPEVELAPNIFDIQVNVPVIHEAVRAQLAAARAGTHSTKTRAEVRGGGRKPWRQKGTGRARHGSIREPQWVGGGVAHGPKPRDHSLRINRKVKVIALRSALTDRAREGKVIVVDLPDFEEPETSKAVELLETWGSAGRVLLIVGTSEDSSLVAAVKSFRNIPRVLVVTYPTTYTVMAAATVIFTRPALEAFVAGSSAKASETPEGPPASRPLETVSEQASGAPDGDVADAGGEKA